jgi:recombinational DNA repair protein RecR
MNIIRISEVTATNSIEELQKALTNILSQVNKCTACKDHLTDTVFKKQDMSLY